MKPKLPITDARALTLGLVVLVLIVLWGAMIISSLQERRAVIQAEKEHLGRMAQIVSEQTASIIRELRLFMQIFEVWMNEHPSSDPRFDPSLIRLVNTYRQASPSHIDIRLVSECGGLFYIPSTNRSPLADVSDREYFTVQTNWQTRGFYISTSVKSRVTGHWGIPFSYPLPQNRFGLAAVFAVLNIPTLNRIYEDARSKPDGTVTLVRNDGKILTRAPFVEEVMAGDFNIPALASMYTNTSTDSITLVSYSPVDHRKRVLAYHVIQDLPLQVLVTSGYNRVVWIWARSLLIKALGLLVLSTLVVMLGLRLRRLIGRLKGSQIELQTVNGLLELRMEQLNEELKQKELIVREVHHRMKNHMAQLISLISLSKSSPTADVFESLKARVHSFAVLYEKLSYSTQNEAKVELKPYLESLFEKVLEVYQGQSIATEVACPVLELDSKKSTVIGLIVSELLTNSIKYGLSNQPRMLVSLTVQKEGDRLRLDYADNGPGFDYEGFVKDSKNNHLGFILINTFVTQYQGSLAYDRSQGSRFTILI